MQGTTCSSSCDTLPHSGQSCHSIRTGRSCFVGSVRYGYFPFFVTLRLDGSLCLVSSRNFILGVAFHCVCLGLVGPFFHGLVLFLRLSLYRASEHKMCCFLFRHGFLQPVTSFADLGGSSKYSNENFEDRRGERFHVNNNWTWVSRS